MLFFKIMITIEELCKLFDIKISPWNIDLENDMKIFTIETDYAWGLCTEYKNNLCPNNVVEYIIPHKDCLVNVFDEFNRLGVLCEYIAKSGPSSKCYSLYANQQSFYVTLPTYKNLVNGDNLRNIVNNLFY